MHSGKGFRILFFSTLRDETRCDEMEMEASELAGTPTVRALLDRLYERFPSLASWDASILVAADAEYVGRDAVLQEGQEIAIMPPVQGG